MGRLLIGVDLHPLMIPKDNWGLVGAKINEFFVSVISFICQEDKNLDIHFS